MTAAPGTGTSLRQIDRQLLGRLVLGWAVVVAIMASLLFMTARDRSAREEAARDQARDQAADVARQVEQTVRREFDRLRTTATTLLAGDVDVDTLGSAVDLAAAPFIGVIDVSTGRFLAHNLGDEIDDADLTLDTLVVFLPHVQEAVDGRPTVAELIVPEPPQTYITYAVPFAGRDGGRRIFATGADLIESSLLEDLQPATPDVGLSLVHGDAVLYTDLLSALPVLAESAVANTPWTVQLHGMATTFDPSLDRLLNGPVAYLAIVVGMLGIGGLWTSWIRQAAAVRRSYAALQVAASHQREVTAVMAHELRTPVTRALGMANLLDEHWTELDDGKRGDITHRLHMAASDLATLVEDLQAVIDVTGAGVQPQLTTIPAHQAVERALATVTTMPADLHLDIDEDATLQIDPGLFDRVLVSLIDNAVTHGAEPIEVSVRRNGTRATVAVRDHGPGVPPDFVDDLFEPFTQAQGHLRRDHGGTGIGLFLARALVEVSGGTLTYEPAEPGSRFVLDVPTPPSRNARPR